MMRKSVVPVAMLALVLVVAACSKKVSSVSVQSPGGELVTSPPATASMELPSPTTISSGSTTVDIGGGELPSGFPSSFPIPDGSAPVYSVSEGQGFAVWFSSGQSVDELGSFFDDNLPSGGWTVESKTSASDSASGSFTAYAISGNGYSGGIYVGAGAPGSQAFSGNFAFFVVLQPTGA